MGGLWTFLNAGVVGLFIFGAFPFINPMLTMTRRALLSLLLFGLLSLPAQAQKPKIWTSADIHAAIEKLNVLGSALYVAAHPDDENTRLIAYLANDLKVNTAYLSLTRGDGGQNLIGPEIRELLGVIRTQELLAARRTDGGNQLFTRANDFGYSKHPDETLRLWNEEEVLSDVVWAIRKWRPDIIINRFDHNSAGRTHGHHTSSALLSVEAFDLAADPDAFPEQLQWVQPWQPRRLFFNTSWWFYGSREAFEKADKSDMVAVDVGSYLPWKGKSVNEIAAESRSFHKSQGFGSAGSRGSQIEYLQLLKGDLPEREGAPFAGIDLSWNRVEGGAPIGRILEQVARTYDFRNPAASVPELLRAYRLIEALPDGYWKRVKSREIREVIQACLGLFLEAAAESSSATPGETVRLELEATNRSSVPLTLKAVQVLPMNLDSTLETSLPFNQPHTLELTVTLPEDMPLTNPYWLNRVWGLGMYEVDRQEWRGLPETPRFFRVAFQLEVDGVPLTLEKEVVYKTTDPVKGEVYQPFEVTLPVFANLAEEVYIFTNSEPKTIEVIVRAGKDDLHTQVTLAHPQGWRIEPAFAILDLKNKGEEQTLRFQLFPPDTPSVGKISPIVRLGTDSYTRKLVVIDYDHIPLQRVALPSESRVVKMNLQRAGRRVGYLMGAGDKVPESLRQIGYEVELLEVDELSLERLQGYDAVILGVRAYNTLPRLKYHQKDLFAYVEQGGTLIVQYNTAHRLQVPPEELAPYPLKLSRDRVTVEEAEVRFLAPDHPVLNYPNRITARDFEGWVQERGLYFPNEWDAHFTPILSCNDPGESPKDGGLLVAPYGKGFYVYTGYSWFRQLPAGVPGAFRLFANLISLGKKGKP